MIYHVSVNGNDKAPGTADAPFRTISRAAEIAVSGDVVKVHGGTYRECVDPRFGGENDHSRIVYEAADGEHPVIKGSEVITDWEHVFGTVWKKEIPSSFFGDFNPYAELVWGDWLVAPVDTVHLGEVYINGRAMFEAHSPEDLYSDEIRDKGYQNDSFKYAKSIQPPESTLYRWYATVDKDLTTIICNFRDIDPNSALIEINVRRSCFTPSRTGVDYITLRGFEIAHAASPWAPPTAHQIGMVGPNWAKGWIIEDNDIHDAKCGGICLGKEPTSGENKHTIGRRKSGHRYQLEATYRAIMAGWCREKVGSHVIRNNRIHHCGQNGIVGNLGGVFSRIEHNHIYEIGQKHEFWGHELGGIKLHAAIDVVIEHNNIHNCTFGIWLDWQAQGTRVSANLIHNNDRDLMIEVTHGPCLVDNNILLSPIALINFAQGTAFAHNLIAGAIELQKVLDRNTPYHLPHSTTPLGFSEVYAGDDRVYNNVFLGCGVADVGQFTSCYDFCSDPDSYREELTDLLGQISGAAYRKVEQPVWIENNVYSGLATPSRHDSRAISADGYTASVSECDGSWQLTLTVPEEALCDCELVSTATLGQPRTVEQAYESPDGSPIVLDADIIGNRRGRIIPGPFADLAAGKTCITVWK